MFATDPVEVNALRRLIEVFFDQEIWGMPVKTALDVTLAALICYGIVCRGGKLSWNTLAWAFTRRGDQKPQSKCVNGCIPPGGACDQCPPESLSLPPKDAVEFTTEHRPVSAVLGECFQAMTTPEPVYDPTSFVLSCLGLQIAFSADGPAAEVRKVTFGDKDVKPLLADDEWKILIDHATQLKLQVVSRDALRANRALASEMRASRMELESRREMERMQRRLDVVKQLRGSPLKDEGAQTLPFQPGQDEPGEQPDLMPAKNTPPVGRSKMPPSISPPSSRRG